MNSGWEGSWSERRTSRGGRGWRSGQRNQPSRTNKERLQTQLSSCSRRMKPENKVMHEEEASAVREKGSRANTRGEGNADDWKTGSWGKDGKRSSRARGWWDRHWGQRSNWKWCPSQALSGCLWASRVPRWCVLGRRVLPGVSLWVEWARSPRPSLILRASGATTRGLWEREQGFAECCSP